MLAQHVREADASPRARYEVVREALAALARSIGPSALETLMNRAVGLTLPLHPFAPDLQRLLRKNGAGNEVESLADIHGSAEVGAALEALLVALLQLLSRLIGDEMSVRILTVPPASPRQRHADKGPE